MSDPAGPHPRRRLALFIALAADALQIVLLPLLLPGVAVDDAIDLVVAIVMIKLLGWHVAFLPTFVAELVPGMNLLPTWTAAVWFVTRKRKLPPVVEPPSELPPPQLPG
ncbi:MAG TPA: hypothetical protein VKF80_08595 [Candidatus Eisenbacteria bacterium]|nr:hypothetical protein [Candidatus Eisenbacteria bacterium]